MSWYVSCAAITALLLQVLPSSSQISILCTIQLIFPSQPKPVSETAMYDRHAR